MDYAAFLFPLRRWLLVFAEVPTAGRYLVERVLRLLVPLYTVGVFILLPPQLYWDSLTNGRFTGSFWQFYPEYFKHFYFEFVAPFVLPWPGHLWFLVFLFSISLVSLPLMVFLKVGIWKAFAL